MKKNLFTILMLLLSVTASWAGDGNGSKDNPYSGGWDLKDLTQIIRIGDYLAYDCVLSGGLTVVTDSKLDKKIFDSMQSFAFKDPIGDAPKDEYAVYCENNKPEERQQQAFLVKDVVVYLGSNPTLKITGHYTGDYEKSEPKDTVHVETADGFFDAFKSNYDKRGVVIKITKDIDMANIASDWSDYINRKDLEFQATIDGYYTAEDSLGRESIAQHSIKNFNSMLVSTMTNATVKGIKLHNWKKHPNVAEDWHPAMLAGRATNCTFQDITLEECSYNDQWLSDLASYVRSGFGLMVNNMDGCTVDSVRIVGCSVQKIGAGVGAIAGIAENSLFRGCYTDHYTSLFAEASNAYVGGFVGKAEKCIFEDCVNMASVMGSEKADNVGGFTGTCTRCRFVNCINTGPLSQISRSTFENYKAIKEDSFLSLMNTIKDKLISLSEYDAVWKHLQMKVDNVAPLKVRGMPQHIQSQINLREFRSAMIKTCVINVVSLLWTIKGEVDKALCPDEMGGISGAAHGSMFDRCFNGGLLHCLDAWCGGIVGRAQTIEKNHADNEMIGVNEFRNCINRGYVQGDELVGGIVGELEDGHISNCLNMGTVDCYNDTRGSMYGKTGSSKPVTNCFTLSHEESDYKFGGENDPNKIHNVSLLDIKSGRVANELNQLSHTNYFCQSVGEDPCPIFNGEIVTPASIRDDVNITYEVDSLADFLYAMFDQYAEITLKNDIDFANSWVTLYRQTFPFRGKIDGDFHAIKNLKVKIDGSEEDNNIYHWYENLYRGTRDYYALIGAAEGATFKNLKIEDFDMALPERDAILVGLSINNTYEKVRLAGKSSIVAPVWAGGLVYESREDRFVDCTIGKDCKIGSSNFTILDYDGDAAGIASQAHGSTFIHCVNNGDIYSRTDGAGGIVGDAYDDCVFEKCVNNGYVHHSSTKIKDDDEIGGIAATAEKCTFIQCVNNGHLLCNDEYGGGIVGRGDNVKIDNCLNASQNLQFSENTCGGIIGTAKNSKVTNCFSYADYALIGKNDGMDEASGNNYQLTVKTVCNSPYVMGVTPKMTAAGYVTYWLNNSAENQKTKPWSQNINQRDYLEVDPHPVLDMHEPVNIEDITGFTYISSADDLKNFAKRVNEGKDDAQYACAVVSLDIDLNGEEWTPIGTDAHRFRGLFDGQGHTIKGLKCSVTGGNKGAGLFGVADALASIENVIIDSNSEISNSTDFGAAGIVGLVSSNDKQWGDVHIRNCGNYASVSAPNQAGGILGRVMNNKSNSQVKVCVENCFNMGTITGKGNSALLCGYMQNRGVVSGCWSGGKLLSTAGENASYSVENPSSEPEFFVGYDSSLHIENCYAVEPGDSVQNAKEGITQNGVTNVKMSDATQGNLTLQLNGTTNDTSKQLVWQQNLGADAHPVFGNKGIYHARNIKEEYGTVCLPYTLYSNDDVKFYGFSNVVEDENEIRLQFQYASKIMPGTPTIFHSKTTGDHTFIDEPDKYEGTYNKYDFDLSIEKGGKGWMMHSHPFKKVFEGEDAKTVYYLSNNELKNDEKTTIAPYHVYFRGPSADELTSWGIKTVRLVIEDEEGSTTVIQSPELMRNEQCVMRNYYNLAGQKVGDSYRGIVIKNGKKVLVK